jgi:hypothetical protein
MTDEADTRGVQRPDAFDRALEAMTPEEIAALPETIGSTNVRSPDGRSVKIYLDRNDWWIGAYRGPNHWYICPLPCVVIRWRRNG